MKAVIDENIVKKAERYVREKFERKLSDNCHFHNINHTLDVARRAQVIGENSKMNQDELNTLTFAALFHDVGYLSGHKDHEQRSAEEASRFLQAVGINGEAVEQVRRSIMATQIPQNPTDKISMALCDADLAHLGDERYFENMDLMRKEWQESGRAVLSKREFDEMSVEFFTKHQYHTDYGKAVLGIRKQHNLDRIRDRIRKME